MKILRIFIMIYILLTGGILSAGNLEVGVDYNGSYSDNLFMNASMIDDYTSQFRTSLDLSVKQLNIYLEASAGVYAENPEFNSVYLHPGIQFVHILKGRNALYLSLSYHILNYRELYVDFNYTGPEFEAGLKLYTGPQALAKMGYKFESRNYPNYDSFDFQNHNLFLQFNRFFDSQTTIRLQAGLNYRYYPHIVEGFDFGENYDYLQMQNNQYKGHQKGPHMGGHGGGHNGTPQTGYSHTSLSVPNLYIQLRIVQGIGTRLGITGEGEYRHNFQGLENLDALIKNAYTIYPLNDDFLWQGYRLGFRLKWIVFKDISIQGRVGYYDKGYPGIPALDQDGNPVEPGMDRQDELLLYALAVSKKINRLDLALNLEYRDNQSNDKYFHYSVLAISAGIGYYF